MTDRFGTLRSILQQPPCKETWDALCEELALWDDEELEREAVPYALSHLDRWPKDLPRAARADALVEWAHSGRAEPALWVANHVEIPSIALLLQLARSPLAARITCADLYCADLAPHTIAQTADALMCMPLRALTISNNRSGPDRIDPTPIFAQLTLPDLHTLSLLLQLKEPAALTRLLANDPRWASLTDLSWRLSYHEPMEMDLAALAASPHLTRLTALELVGIKLAPGDEEALLKGHLLDHIEHLTLDNAALQDTSAIRLVHHPKLARLTHLSLAHNNQLSAATTQAIASSPHLTHLTALDLSRIYMNDAGQDLQPEGAPRVSGLDALFSSAHLPALRTLTLDGDTLDPQTAARIADAPWPPQLQCPVWDRAILSVEAAVELARCPQLRTLTQLTPDIERLPPSACAALLTSPHLTGLRTLKLYYPATTDAHPLRTIAHNPALAHIEELRVLGSADAVSPDLCALLTSPHIARLTTLTLYASVQDDALRAIARSPHLPRLTQLTIRVEAPTTATIRALMDAPLAAQLRLLDLVGALPDEAARCFADAPALTQLKTLRLSDAQVSPTTFLALLTSPHLQQLDELKLDLDVTLDAQSMTTLAHSPALLRTSGALNRCGITAATLPLLLDSPHLPQLTALSLNHNPLGDAGAAILAAHPALLHLNRLNLSHTDITLDGIRLLAHSPHLRNLHLMLIHMNSRAERAQAHAIMLTSPHISPALRNILTQRLHLLTRPRPTLPADPG
jgi:hypothetical protein